MKTLPPLKGKRKLRRGRGEGIAKKRPAEKVSGLSAAVLVAAYLFDIRDPEVLTALGVLIGLIPGAMTWLVELMVSASAPTDDSSDEESYDFDAVREFARLKTEGIISEDQFAEKRAELLDLEE